MKPTKTTTPPIKNSISRAPWWRDLLLIVITCFAALPTVQAAAPDGNVGNGCTAEGAGALSRLTSGSFNTALGLQALFSNTTGIYNTGTGVNALYSNTNGAYNTANGGFALFSNTTGNDNTATGVNALVSNSIGSDNTAMGFKALFSNTDGRGNTATGFEALQNNTIGGDNTATGVQALLYNTTGIENTAAGVTALLRNRDGNDNTVIGVDALYTSITVNNNTAIGYRALVNNLGGSNNIAIGFEAGKDTTGDNNINIGSTITTFSGCNTIAIGSTQTATFIAGISGATASGGAAVFVDSGGQLGTATSSRRFKQEIKPMDKASEAILALRPVTFRYKQEIDPKGIPQFGLVAEEVEQVNPDLVVRDANGKVYTVRYEAVNAMLLNEFLKEHCKMQEQQATITRLESKVAKQEAAAERQQKDFQATAARQQEQIEALTTGLQKVSHQLEVSKAAPQLVAGNQ